jgi:Alcohol dehydrogenase GroES-like domain
MKIVRRILKWTSIVILMVLLASSLFLFIAYWTSSNDCERKTALTHPMKAIRKCEYGSVTLRDVEKPTPTDDQVLVKVRAASLNAADGHLLRGFAPMRILTGLRRPKDTRFGIDCAGTVEAVGKNVTQFKPGDNVFGAAKGAMAQYALASERQLVTKPDNITFEQAGSVAVAGLTALQGLRDQGKIQPGQKVLINGASGGVGTFAVQIAKAFGTEVTAVCSSRNLDQARREPFHCRASARPDSERHLCAGRNGQRRETRRPVGADRWQHESPCRLTIHFAEVQSLHRQASQGRPNGSA